MKKEFIKYIIVTIIGGLMTLSVFSYKNLSSATNSKDIVMILSDGFLLPGVIILGVGLLIAVSNGGIFDIFTYTLRKMRETIILGEKRSKEYNSYFDYRMSKEKAKCAFLIIIGGLFFTLALTFNIAFYYV